MATPVVELQGHEGIFPNVQLASCTREQLQAAFPGRYFPCDEDCSTHDQYKTATQLHRELTAEQLAGIQQGSPAWHLCRSKHITGSTVTDLLGFECPVVNRLLASYQVYHAAKGPGHGVQKLQAAIARLRGEQAADGPCSSMGAFGQLCCEWGNRHEASGLYTLMSYAPAEAKLIDSGFTSLTPQLVESQAAYYAEILRPAHTGSSSSSIGSLGPLEPSLFSSLRIGCSVDGLLLLPRCADIVAAAAPAVGAGPVSRAPPFSWAREAGYQVCVVEVKCPAPYYPVAGCPWAFGVRGSSSCRPYSCIKAHHYCQAQLNMMVTGTEQCVFLVWTRSRTWLLHLPVNKPWLHALLHLLKAVHDRYVAAAAAAKGDVQPGQQSYEEDKQQQPRDDSGATRNIQQQQQQFRSAAGKAYSDASSSSSRSLPSSNLFWFDTDIKLRNLYRRFVLQTAWLCASMSSERLPDPTGVRPWVEQAQQQQCQQQQQQQQQQLHAQQATQRQQQQHEVWPQEAQQQQQQQQWQVPHCNQQQLQEEGQQQHLSQPGPCLQAQQQQQTEHILKQQQQQPGWTPGATTAAAAAVTWVSDSRTGVQHALVRSVHLPWQQQHTLQRDRWFLDRCDPDAPHQAEACQAWLQHPLLDHVAAYPQAVISLMYRLHQAAPAAAAAAAGSWQQQQWAGGDVGLSPGGLVLALLFKMEQLIGIKLTSIWQQLPLPAQQVLVHMKQTLLAAAAAGSTSSIAAAACQHLGQCCAAAHSQAHCTYAASSSLFLLPATATVGTQQQQQQQGQKKQFCSTAVHRLWGLRHHGGFNRPWGFGGRWPKTLNNTFSNSFNCYGSTALAVRQTSMGRAGGQQQCQQQQQRELGESTFVFQAAAAVRRRNCGGSTNCIRGRSRSPKHDTARSVIHAAQQRQQALTAARYKQAVQQYPVAELLRVAQQQQQHGVSLERVQLQQPLHVQLQQLLQQAVQVGQLTVAVETLAVEETVEWQQQRWRWRWQQQQQRCGQRQQHQHMSSSIDCGGVDECSDELDREGCGKAGAGSVAAAAAGGGNTTAGSSCILRTGQYVNGGVLVGKSGRKVFKRKFMSESIAAASPPAAAAAAARKCSIDAKAAGCIAAATGASSRVAAAMVVPETAAAQAAAAGTSAPAEHMRHRPGASIQVSRARQPFAVAAAAAALPAHTACRAGSAPAVLQAAKAASAVSSCSVLAAPAAAGGGIVAAAAIGGGGSVATPATGGGGSGAAAAIGGRGSVAAAAAAAAGASVSVSRCKSWPLMGKRHRAVSIQRPRMALNQQAVSSGAVDDTSAALALPGAAGTGGELERGGRSTQGAPAAPAPADMEIEAAAAGVVRRDDSLQCAQAARGRTAIGWQCRRPTAAAATARSAAFVGWCNLGNIATAAAAGCDWHTGGGAARQQFQALLRSRRQRRVASAAAPAAARPRETTVVVAATDITAQVAACDASAEATPSLLTSWRQRRAAAAAAAAAATAPAAMSQHQQLTMWRQLQQQQQQQQEEQPGVRRTFFTHPAGQASSNPCGTDDASDVELCELLASGVLDALLDGKHDM